MLIIDRFEEIVDLKKDKIALVDSEKEITFYELRDKAKILAKKINFILKKTNQPIMVEVDRKVETIISFLAVLYSGNFYVPVNNKDPQNRILEIKEKLESEIGIFHKKNIFEGICDSIDFSFEDREKYEDINLGNILKEIIDTDPAYILFTSGSTGSPKGVVISNRMVLDLIDWIIPALGIKSDYKVANQTPFYFDASVKELALLIGAGNTIYIMEKSLFMFPIKVVEYLNDNEINVILWSVSAINLLANSKVFDLARPNYLKIITFAGEALSAQKLNYWQKFIDADYFNLYGPTETTVDCCYYKVNRTFKNEETIPIGRACENMNLMILDGDKLSDYGELVVRGTGVSYGYYNDLEKTDKVFVQNPLNKSYPEKVYRTGDIVRLNDFGEIEFLSRKDSQIKLHGFRIEMGEIERAIFSLGVKDVICIFDKDNEKIVAIYSGDEIPKNKFRKELKNLIPAYMIPEVFINLEDLPKTSNTKVDRKKLEKDYYNGKI